MKKLVSCLCVVALLSVCICNVLLPAYASNSTGTTYTTVADKFAKAEELGQGREILTPGTITSMQEEDYYIRWVRGQGATKDSGKVYDFNVMPTTISAIYRPDLYGFIWGYEPGSTDATVYSCTLPAATVEAAAQKLDGTANWSKYSSAIGQMMGIRNEYRVISPKMYAGCSVIFKVKPGTYVSSSLIGSNADIFKYETYTSGTNTFSRYTFAVSADGDTWTSLNATIDYNEDGELDSKWSADGPYHAVSTKATVQIPATVDGYNGEYVYYRITLPGFVTGSDNTSLSELVWNNTLEGLSGVGYNTNRYAGIGTTICSAYDLTEYDLYTDVPDLQDSEPDGGDNGGSGDDNSGSGGDNGGSGDSPVIDSAGQTMAKVSNKTAGAAILTPGSVDTMLTDRYVTNWVRTSTLNRINASVWQQDINFNDGTDYKNGLIFGGGAYPGHGYYAGYAGGTSPMPSVISTNDDSKLANQLVGSNAAQNYTQVMGTIFGITNKKRLSAYQHWAGASVIYKVVPGSYVATSLIGVAEADSWFKKYTFAVSVDGDTWVPLTVDENVIYKRESDWTSNGPTYFRTYNAITKIPQIAGAGEYVYYRVTLPGIKDNLDQTLSTDNNMTWTQAYIDAEGINSDYNKFFGIGTTVCSAYDLTQYSTWTDVPDHQEADDLVFLKTNLGKVLKQVKAYNLTFVKEDDAQDKADFETVLAQAQALYDDPNADLSDVAAMSSTLLAAFLKVDFDYTNEIVLPAKHEKNFLKPGVMDNMATSFKYNVNGGYSTANGYVTPYAEFGVYTGTSGYDANPNQVLSIASYSNYMLYSGLSFMGQPLTKTYYSNRAWAGAYLQYRVYGGSYIATAIIVDDYRYNMTVNPNDEYQMRYDLMPDAQKEVRYLVSKDNVTYEEIEPVSLTLVENGKLVERSTGSTKDASLYKAVVKIPEGYSYYRIVYPGAQELSYKTAYYKGSPDMLVSLGQSVASMYDLTNIDDYNDIPDKCEYYEDPSIEIADYDVVTGLSTKYFKLKNTKTTIRQAKQAVTITNGSLGFFDAQGKLITDDSTVITYAMRLDILDAKGIPYLSSTSQDRYRFAMGNDIVEIEPLDPIILDCGTDKTVEGMMLMPYAYIVTGAATVEAEIEWDLDACPYDPTDAREQSFTVYGKIVLPQGVTNSGNLPLTVKVNCLVEETKNPSVVVKDGVDSLLIDSKEQIIYFQGRITAKDLLAMLRPYGNVYYRLTKYSMESGNVVNVADDEIVDSFMTVDIYSVKGDVYRLSLQLENMNWADVSVPPVEDDTSVETPITGRSVLPVVMAVFLLLISAIVVVISRKKTSKA